MSTNWIREQLCPNHFSTSIRRSSAYVGRLVRSGFGKMAGRNIYEKRFLTFRAVFVVVVVVVTDCNYT